MYSNHSVVLTGQEKLLQDVLGNAVESLQWRLENYDEGNDPLERGRISILLEVVSQERDKVEAGNPDHYSDLAGPRKAASDWGEPYNSVLMRSLCEVERFFRNGNTRH